jgi:nucleotide-binding universal stress UspA family protein
MITAAAYMMNVKVQSLHAVKKDDSHPTRGGCEFSTCAGRGAGSGMACPLRVDRHKVKKPTSPRRCAMAPVPVILVAVDGTDRSMNTVDYLSRILAPKNVSIELYHVLADAPESFFDWGEEERTAAYASEIEKWRSSRRIQIDRFMDEARKTFVNAGFPSGSVSTTVQPRNVGIARDIIRKSSQGFAAVVIGRKGFGTLPEFMLGSIAAKLADTVAHVPLAIVGGQPETRKVLVAVDRSRAVRKGLDQLSPLLVRTFEDILLCHIVRPLSEPHPARTPYFSSRDEAHWVDENSRKIIPTLVEVRQRLSQVGFDQKSLRTAILKEKTSRAEGLWGEAGTLGAGTIIIGRRGATTVEEFSMGRVTRKILYMAFEKAIWII